MENSKQVSDCRLGTEYDCNLEIIIWQGKMTVFKDEQMVRFYNHSLMYVREVTAFSND